MPRAFAVLPFSDPYPARYEETFKPALEAAGLDVETVAERPGVDVIIEAIQKMIRDADIVFVDLSEDNTNVWYEFGYANALGKPVVMVCDKAKRSAKLPFDIGHRRVLFYETKSAGDFTELSSKITAEATAKLESDQRLEQIESRPLVADMGGLSQMALAAMAVVMGETGGQLGTVSFQAVKSRMESEGYNDMGASIGLVQLERHRLIDAFNEDDGYGDRYTEYRMTEEGMTWVLEHHGLFSVKSKPGRRGYGGGSSGDTPYQDEDIPY